MKLLREHPANEPVRSYPHGSPERASLRDALATLEVAPPALSMRIGEESVTGTGRAFAVHAPHRHGLQLGEARQATGAEVGRAIDMALQVAPAWSRIPWETRASVFLRAAELLSGPWRDRLNAATILGQSKSWVQSELDAACELIDFWRWNVHLANSLRDEQPVSPRAVWNRLELRPLEGFVLAISPFNFTSIATNLPTAPALMGNTVVWKPAPAQQLAASVTMQLLDAAGLPPGVINLVTGDGAALTEVAIPHPRLAGVHFTGSTQTFRDLWSGVAANLGSYRTYPRIVGETGGKDFLVAHRSADFDSLLIALVRGAFEYQGQKCSAVSRAYIPATLWAELREPLAEAARTMAVGDPGEPTTFMGAVIDERSYRRLEKVIVEARFDSRLTLITGGDCDAAEGWFVQPTIYETSDVHHPLLERELFGPILVVLPYTNEGPNGWEAILDLIDTTSPYGLTGAVMARDRNAIDVALDRLRDSAGNIYVNDKPTGAVVGQQPFGGARASGTNDKAGSVFNLMRWVSPRVIKETFVPPTDWRYAEEAE